MSNCVNMNSKDFQDLVQQTGLNPLILKSRVGVWSEYTGLERLPSASEILEYQTNKEAISEDAESVRNIFGEENVDSVIFEANNLRDVSAAAVFSTSEEANSAARKNMKGVQRYIDYKKELLLKLSANIKNYKVLNKAKKGEEDYQKKLDALERTFSKVEEEIEQLSIAKMEEVVQSIIGEIEYLDGVLSNQEVNLFNIQNREILARLENLSNILLGKDLKGYNIPESEMGVKLSGADIPNFESIVTKMTNLNLKFENFMKKTAQEAIMKNPLFVANANKFTQEQINDIVAGSYNSLADIGTYHQMFSGINSNTDTVFSKTIDNVFDMNVKRVMASVAKDTARLTELYSVLKKNKFDNKNFYKKDENGIPTGQLISKYTTKWNNVIGLFKKREQEFLTSNSAKKKAAYKELIGFYDTHTQMIDIRRLKVFKDKYGEDFGEHFTFDDKTMSDYEAHLRKELGKTYESEIKSQMEALDEYVSRIENVKTMDVKSASRTENTYSPFMFLDNYFSNNKLETLDAINSYGDHIEVYNIGKYNRFIPRRFEKGTQKETGYYDNNFDKTIENDDNAYEAWSLFKKLLSEHINPAYSLDGKNIAAYTIPMLRKEFAETLAEAKKSGVFAMIRAAVHHLINMAKDNFFEDTTTMNKKGVVSNYSNTAAREVKAYKAALMLKTQTELLNMAAEKGLTYGPEFSKKDIADGIARAEVLKDFSTDIFQNVLAVSQLAVTQRARRDSTFIVELLYNEHIKVKDEKGEDRTKSNRKLREWINVMVYGSRNKGNVVGNDMISKAKTKRFSDADKRLKEVLEEVSKQGANGETEFNLNGVAYTQRVVTTDGVSKTEFYRSRGEDGKGLDKISEAEFQEKLGEYINNSIDSLGINMTAVSLCNGVIAMLSAKYLGFNIKSGIKNRIDGLVNNVIRDAEGIMFTKGNMKNSERILTGANLMRFSNGKLDFINKKKAAQMKTLDMLVQQFGILQDRKDFRDKKNQVSSYDKYKESLNLYNWSINMPEYHNQISLMLSIMQDVKIKDKDGNEVSYCNGTGMDLKDGKLVNEFNYFPAYKPGTTELRDEFKYTKEAFNADGSLRTDVDLKQFINKENIGFETFEVDDVNLENNKVHAFSKKVQDTINKTQGNFSSMDTQLVMNSVMGRFAMVFKRYLPELINQRFGTIENDIVQGNDKYEGRFRILGRNPGALAITSTVLMGVSFGPIGAAIAAGLSTTILPFLLKNYSQRWFGKEMIAGLADNGLVMAGMLQEMLIRTCNLPLVVFKAKKDLMDIKPISQGWGIKKATERGAITEAEAGALAATSQEIAFTIATILLMLAAKDLLGGGDDDDDKSKQTRNYIDNFGNQLLQNLEIFYNPKAFFENTSQLIALNIYKDAAKFFKMVQQHVSEDKYTTGDIVGQFMKTPIVPVFNAPVKFFSSFGESKGLFRDEDEFTKGQWFDNHNITEEALYKKRMMNNREQLKDIYINDLIKRLEEEGYEKEIAEKTAKETAKKMMRSKEVGRDSRAGEEFKDAYERIDYDMLKDNAEETVDAVDIVEPKPEESTEE